MAKAKKKTVKKKKTTKKKVTKKKPSTRKNPVKKAKKKVSRKKKVTRKKTNAKAKAKKTKKKKTAVKKKTPKTKSKKRISPKKKVTKKKAARKNIVLEIPPIEIPQMPMNSIPEFDLEGYEPEMPIERGIRDTFFGSVRYAWIGSGQCGGRLVRAFYELGYRRVIATNTTRNDLDSLKIPAGQKYLMDIGKKGAGKDMSRGKAAAKASRQDLMHLARQTFGDQFDHIMVCIGAGGGTGGGSAVELVDIARRYARSVGKSDPNRRVGVVMTLPTIGEASSKKVAKNAYEVATELGKMAMKGRISPLIIVDNQKISRMYPNLTVKEFWPTINSTVAGLFDVFNRLSHLSSPYTSFDPVDYLSIIGAGGCAVMGLTKVQDYTDHYQLSSAVKKNLENTLLSDGFDLSTAKAAGSIAVGGKFMMATTPGLQDNIDYAFDVLADITGNATIHRGIYEDQRESLRVYTIVGGMDFPTNRINELVP